MSVWSALAPFLGLLAAGGAVAALAARYGRRRSGGDAGLPTDPLADFFTGEDTGAKKQ